MDFQHFLFLQWIELAIFEQKCKHGTERIFLINKYDKINRFDHISSCIETDIINKMS